MTTVERTIAWLVHLYTATGLLCAAGMAVLIVRGDDISFRRAFGLMMVATFVDATDGWLARRARVKEVLPGFSGRALDDLIDFHTYTSLPLLLAPKEDVQREQLQALSAAGLAPLGERVARTSAHTRDLGLAFHLAVVDLALPALKAASALAKHQLIAGLEAVIYADRRVSLHEFVVLTFVPTTYIYATQGGRFSRLINVGSGIWFVALGWILWSGPDAARVAASVSLIYPALYLALSAIVTVSGRTRRRSSAP